MKRFITQTLSRYFRISIGQPARAKPVSMYRQNVTSKGKVVESSTWSQNVSLLKTKTLAPRKNKNMHRLAGMEIKPFYHCFL